MVSPPIQPTDVFDLARETIAGTSRPDIPGFNAPIVPSQSGFQTVGASIPNERNGVFTRNMVRWFVPEVGVVEMYINPKSISYQFKKHITNQRTKGGYLLQYWGEELTQLGISGTTGSSGIEGINILQDIYQSEQLAFDPYALSLAAERDAENNDQFSFLGDFEGGLGGLVSGAGGSFLDLVSNSIETGAPNATRAQPTLASLAFSVEMYYSGWVFRGYFTDFRLDESADKLGLFDYSMTFFVTQRRGLRLNYFPWHRSASDGPSNSDPEFGVPHSFAHFGTNSPTAVPPLNENEGSTLGDLLLAGKNAVGLVDDAVTGGISSITSIF